MAFLLWFFYNWFFANGRPEAKGTGKNQQQPKPEQDPNGNSGRFVRWIKDQKHKTQFKRA
ncbi:hypothetical protein Pyn_16696 [Prunus yedoensis var. nudiflora]|uniref:Uncharacterized protein n=1 Tax=Prunus yedoensis var. nudiflora TaxID=2094558 RepID=A0A314YD59_PRUYE|nr:hypothetical protein Pyn_16696 [Prunus yedoensis var. nudiflora]